MDFKQQYMVLAAQLGDIQYKLELFEMQKQAVLGQIKELDKMAGEANAQKNETAQGNNAGNNSPA